MYRCRFDIDTQTVPGGCVDGAPSQTAEEPPPVADTPTRADIAARDYLIAAQEALLNVYRCRFDIDTQTVPGGCVDGAPSQTAEEPPPVADTPTRADIAARDYLIAAQEALLNVYRCRFDIDTQTVPGGCVDGAPSQTAEEPPPVADTPTRADIAARDYP